MATFILKKDASRKIFWILRSDSNYKTIAMSSEAYENEKAAKDSIEWTRNNALNALFKDET